MKRYFTERKEKGPASYTDLAVERRRADTSVRGIEYSRLECSVGEWENVRVFSDEGARCIGRPCGNYDTLSLGRMDLLSDDEIADATEEIAKKLCQAVDNVNAVPDRILVVGLGNRNLTPDSIGPKTASKIKPTMHIREFDEDMFDALECSEIAILCPGVSAETGMEAAEIVRGISRRIIPDVIIAIDAIATRSTERLGSTVQISDTGLFPGSGIGNYRSALTEDTVGFPIISVGVPTVIDSRVFGSDNESDGICAEGAMLVSPKEIDEIVETASKIIGCAINQAFGISSDC